MENNNFFMAANNEENYAQELALAQQMNIPQGYVQPQQEYYQPQQHLYNQSLYAPSQPLADAKPDTDTKRNNAFLYEEPGSDKKIIAGTVQGVNFFETDSGARRAVVHMKDHTGGKWSVFFSDRPDHPEWSQMAERVEKAKVAPGKFIGVIGFFDTEKRTANGLDFRYEGVMGPYHTPNGGDINIIMGKAVTPRWRPASEKFPHDQLEIRCPVRDRDRNTIWVSVNFVDSDRAQTGTWAKNKYEKTLEPGEKIGAVGLDGTALRLTRNVAIRCGRQKISKSPDGREFISYPGYMLVFGPKIQPKTQEQASYGTRVQPQAGYDRQYTQPQYGQSLPGYQPDAQDTLDGLGGQTGMSAAYHEAVDEGFYYAPDDSEAMLFD